MSRNFLILTMNNNAKYFRDSYQNKLKERERNKIIFLLVGFVTLLQLCIIIFIHSTLRQPFVFPNQCLKIRIQFIISTSVETYCVFETVNPGRKPFEALSFPLPVSQISQTKCSPFPLHHRILCIMIKSLIFSVLTFYLENARMTEKYTWHLTSP